MKLLFDQNLSFQLVRALSNDFPGSQHIRDISLKAASDDAVWEFARDGGFAIVSKDADFHQRSSLYGHPPKVIWISLGNCSTAQIEVVLRRSKDEIVAFFGDSEAAFLAL